MTGLSMVSIYCQAGTVVYAEHISVPPIRGDRMRYATRRGESLAGLAPHDTFANTVTSIAVLICSRV
jgi:hypothetical protein